MTHKSATVHWVQMFAAIVPCMFLRSQKRISLGARIQQGKRTHDSCAISVSCPSFLFCASSSFSEHSPPKLETLSSPTGTFGAGNVASSIHCHLALGNPQSCTWDSSTVMTTVRGSHVEISMPFGLRTNSELLSRAMLPKCMHLSLFWRTSSAHSP